MHKRPYLCSILLIALCFSSLFKITICDLCSQRMIITQKSYTCSDAIGSSLTSTDLQVQNSKQMLIAFWFKPISWCTTVDTIFKLSIKNALNVVIPLAILQYDTIFQWFSWQTSSNSLSLIGYNQPLVPTFGQWYQTTVSFDISAYKFFWSIYALSSGVKYSNVQTPLFLSTWTVDNTATLKIGASANFEIQEVIIGYLYTTTYLDYLGGTSTLNLNIQYEFSEGTGYQIQDSSSSLNDAYFGLSTQSQVNLTSSPSWAIDNNAVTLKYTNGNLARLSQPINLISVLSGWYNSWIMNFWIKLTSNNISPFGKILSRKRSDLTTEILSIYLDSTFKFHVKIVEDTQLGTYAIPSTGIYYMISISINYQTSNQLIYAIYENGNLKIPNTISGTLSAYPTEMASDIMTIGDYTSSFEGYIKQFKIFKNTTWISNSNCQAGCSLTFGFAKSTCALTSSNPTNCPTGQYIDTLTSNCVDCPIQCASCTDPNSCNSCNSPFSLSTGSCICPQPLIYNSARGTCDNCLTYSSTTTLCQTCKDGYYLNNGQCSVCHSDCLTCSGPLSTNCLSCGPLLQLISGQCCGLNCATCNGNLCQTCNNGYYFSSGQCLTCHEDCLTCSGPLATNCLSCGAQLQLISGQCCGLNCATCNGDLCQTCNNGYYFSSGQCLPCHTDCLTCSGPLSTDCLSCGTQLQLLSGQCCGLNCATCNGNLCQTCNTGYYFNSGQCLACSADCLTCSGPLATDCLSCGPQLQLLSGQCCSVSCAICNGNLCQTCNNGYYLSNGQCLPCHTDCLTCSGPLSTDCLSCNTQLQLLSGQCCALNCATCNGHLCQTCNNGDYLYNGICSPCNPYGYYFGNGQCLACHTDCLVCSGPLSTDCIACGAQLHLISGQCCGLNCATCNGDLCQTCNNGYYFSSGQCLPCHTDCLTCSGPLSTNCLSCGAQLQLLSGQCCGLNCATCNGNLCQTCNTGYYFNSGQCLACNADCLTCSGPLATDCLSCGPQLQLLSGQCCSVSCATCNGNLCQTCNNGYYLSNGQCLPCHTDCLTCSGPLSTDCLSCNTQLQFISGRCCDLSCDSCNGNTPNDCLSCASNLILQNGACISNGSNISSNPSFSGQNSTQMDSIIIIPTLNLTNIPTKLLLIISPPESTLLANIYTWILIRIEGLERHYYNYSFTRMNSSVDDNSVQYELNLEFSALAIISDKTLFQLEFIVSKYTVIQTNKRYFISPNILQAYLDGFTSDDDTIVTFLSALRILAFIFQILILIQAIVQGISKDICIPIMILQNIEIYRYLYIEYPPNLNELFKVQPSTQFLNLAQSLFNYNNNNMTPSDNVLNEERYGIFYVYKYFLMNYGVKLIITIILMVIGVIMHNLIRLQKPKPKGEALPGLRSVSSIAPTCLQMDLALCSPTSNQASPICSIVDNKFIVTPNSIPVKLENVNSCKSKIRYFFAWNLLLLYLYINYMDTIFYSILQCKYYTDENLYGRLNLAIAIITGLLITLTLPIFSIHIAWKFIKLSCKPINNHKPDYTSIKPYEFMYNRYKNKKFRQPFLFTILILKQFLIVIIVIFFLRYPLLQTALILMLNIATLCYIFIVMPFRLARYLIKVLINELLYFLASFIVMVFAIMDNENNHDFQSKENLGWVMYTINLLLYIINTIFFLMGLYISIKLWFCKDPSKVRVGIDNKSGENARIVDAENLRIVDAESCRNNCNDIVRNTEENNNNNNEDKEEKADLIILEK